MPDRRDPTEPQPAEEGHGGGLARTLREIDDEQPPAEPEAPGPKEQTQVKANPERP